MNTINDALLSAYLDGELTGTDLASVEAAIANQTGVARRLATLKLVNELTKGHAHSIDALPLPERVQELLAARAVAARQQAQVIPFIARVRAILPVAASVVFGLGLGFVFVKNQSTDAEVPLTAYATLLQTTPSGSTGQGAGVSLTPQFSFISKAQEPCRIYRLDEAGASRMQIACLGESGWTLMDDFPAAGGSDTQQYVPVTGGGAELEARLDSLMQGGPLSREQEQALRDNSWQAL